MRRELQAITTFHENEIERDGKWEMNYEKYVRWF